MNDNYVDVWNRLHHDFKDNQNSVLKYDDWLLQFDDIIKNVTTEIIDLGCGVTGNNTLYLKDKGLDVLSCDFAVEALNHLKENIPGVKTLLFDMTKGLPFNDESHELIIADLSLHYFDYITTKNIIHDIFRVLTPKGHLIVRLNSTNGSEHKTISEDKLEPIERHFYFKSNMTKRFFDKEDIKDLFKEFDIKYMNEESMSRYQSDKIVWKCCFEKNKGDLL